MVAKAKLWKKVSLMIDAIDHIVMTTYNETLCIDFYTRVLGMSLQSFLGGNPQVERKALLFGHQKINIHVKGSEFEPKASIPTPGSLDLCFIVNLPIETIIERLRVFGVVIESGPVLRTGALSKLNSIYIRDPDGNLIELSEPLKICRELSV